MTHGNEAIYTYKRVVCVYLFACLSVFFLSATRHLSTLRRCLRVLREQPSRRGRHRTRAGKRMHSESTRAHAVQLLNEKIAALMPFKNKTVRARWSEPTLVSSSIPIKEQCVFVCLLVCLLFIGHTRFPTLRRCLRVAESRISRRRERPCARGQVHACAQREHARACRTTSQRKNHCADAFQKQNRTRAHAVVYVAAEIFKKKTNMPLPKFSF